MGWKKLLILPSILFIGVSYKSGIVANNVGYSVSDKLNGNAVGYIDSVPCNYSPSSLRAMQAFVDELNPVWFDVSVAGIVPLNNVTEMDYKMSDDVINSVHNRYSHVAQHIEVLNSNRDMPLTENAITNYLKENDIISTDLDISFDGVVLDYKLSDVGKYSDDSLISKSDFMMALGKTAYGVKESRPILIRSKSVRDGSVVLESDSDKITLSNFNPSNFITRELEEGEVAKFNYHFNYGDINIYLTPNVAELYYKDLAKDGVLKLEEFEDDSFTDYYNSIGKGDKPSWDPTLGELDLSNSDSPNPLGNRFAVNRDGSKTIITPSIHTYFKDENINNIDALVYIEKVLRFKEKNLTNLEADIVTYKYGVEYINRVPSEYKDSIKFLITKGVINFENENEFNNLFKPLDFKSMKNYLYRLHNPNARFDFSKIQLTDSDNYLLSKGFGEMKLDMFEGASPYFDTTVVSEVASNTLSNTPSIIPARNTGLSPSIGFLDTVIQSHNIRLLNNSNNVDNKTYKVKRVFDLSDYRFYYKGLELYRATKPEGDIKSVEYNKDKDMLTVEFEVKALSPVSAVAILDANMVTETRNSKIMSIGTVDAIAYVNGENKEQNIFVSQSSIRNLPSLSILVVNDKYLVNKQTGAKALLLNDNKKALIGNHVITFKDTMVTNLNGEVYYNLSILKMLMGEGMLSSLDPSEFFITKGYEGNEKLMNLVNPSNNVVDTMYVRKLLSKIPYTNPNDDKIKPGYKWFLNISQSNALSNYVIYDLKEDLGIEESLKMILEFSYVLPNSSEVGVDQEFIDKFNNGGLTVSEVYNFAYKRPTNPTLVKWWDSNITFSNAIMNHIMGTTDVNYITSGYLMPKITILGDVYKKTSSGEVYFDKINHLFSKGIGLSSTFVNSTLNNSGNELNFINSYFTFQGNLHSSTGDSVLDRLVYKRSFNYLTGVLGKYNEGSISYKESNYVDYGDYVVLGTNDNVFAVPSTIPYIEEFKDGSSSIKLKDTPGVLYQPVGDFSRGTFYKVSDDSRVTEFYSFHSDSSRSYVSLTKPIKMFSDGEDVYADSGYKISLDTKIKEMSNLIFGNVIKNGVVVPHEDYMKSVAPSGVELKKGYYYIGDQFYHIKKKGDKPSIENRVKDRDTKGKEVYVFPAFGLSKSVFKVDSVNKEIIMTNNDPRLNIRNVSNTGIVSNIIDSIVYANSNYTSFGSLPDNAKVSIGTNVYVKSKGRLQSEVVRGSDVISLSGINIESLNFLPQFRSIAETHIGNIAIISKGGGGVKAQFKDYVTDFSFGTGQENSDFSNALRLSDKGYLVVNNGIFSDKYKEGVAFTGFCYSMKVSDNVKFKQVGDTNRYTLVTVAYDSKDGNVSGTSYFLESLDFKDKFSETVGLVPSEFKESANLSTFVEELLKAYDAKRIEDFTGLVAYILRMLAMLLTATNLIVTMLRSPTMDAIVYDIKYKKPKSFSNFSSSNREFEIDLYVILTMGLQNVDTEKSLLRGIVVSGCLAGVTAFLTLMYFKGF